VIVVVGQPIHRAAEAGTRVDGLPARIAMAAAALGRPVELIGKVGEDEAGDAVVLGLARAGVGHVALLREAGRPTRRAAPLDDEAIEAAALGLTGEGFADSAPDAAPDTGLAGSDDPEAALEAADVDLALRYLTEFSVLVLADPVAPDVVRVVATATGWAESSLLVVLPAGGAVPDGLPPEAVVFEAPDGDPDGVFAAMVGAFAAALDDGGEPGEAFRATVDSEGWTPAPAE
jgi:hypothetical protein